MWRDSLDEKAAAAMEEMVSSTEDQESFARAARFSCNAVGKNIGRTA